MSGHPSVRVCVCGHIEARHGRAWSLATHPIPAGVCLTPGCDCKAFELDAIDHILGKGNR